MTSFGKALLVFTWFAGSACVTGTDKPGYYRCTTIFFVVGYTQSCERGPEWTQVGAPPDAAKQIVDARRQAAAPQQGSGTEAQLAQPSPPPTAPPHDWWCTTPADGIGLCMTTRDRCEAFRSPSGPGGASGYGPCALQHSAACTETDCFVSKQACVSFEKAVGRNGAACAARE